MCNFVHLVVTRSELLTGHALQPRDIRFSAASSLYIRGSAIILKLQVGGDILFLNLERRSNACIICACIFKQTWQFNCTC